MIFFLLNFPSHESFFGTSSPPPPCPHFPKFSNNTNICSLRPLFKSERCDYHYPSENNIYFFLFFVNNSHNSLAEPKVPHRAQQRNGCKSVYEASTNNYNSGLSIRSNFVSFVSNSSCYNTCDEI